MTWTLNTQKPPPPKKKKKRNKKEKKKNNFVKFLDNRIREYLICLLGNVYTSKGAAVTIEHREMN